MKCKETIISNKFLLKKINMSKISIGHHEQAEAISVADVINL